MIEQIVSKYQETNDPSGLEPHLTKIYVRMFEYFDGLEKRPIDLSPYKLDIMNHGFKVAKRWNGRGIAFNILATSMMCMGRQIVRSHWNQVALKEKARTKK